MRLYGPKKAITQKKKRLFKRHDELQDRIDEINAFIVVTTPGTRAYDALLEERSKVEDIRKKRKEIKILGLAPKDCLKIGVSAVVTAGIYIFGYLLDVGSPRAMRHAERMDRLNERLSRGE